MALPKAVLFDFFGVICNDQYDIWLGRHGLERVGEFSDLIRELDIGGITLNEFLMSLGQLTGMAPPAIRHEFEVTVEIDNDVVDSIKELRAGGYRVGLLSNANDEWLKRILHIHNLENLFDCVIISAEVKLQKPGAEIFRLALKELGVPAGEVLYIDDRQKNVVMAERLGMRGIYYHSLDDLKERLREFAEVPKSG